MKHEYTDAELQAAALSQLRPIAEAGEVPEGCVRYHFPKYGDDLGVGTIAKHPSDVLFADIRLPEPSEKPDPYDDKPLVTKPISPPTWTPKVGDVVTLKSGGPNMTVVKLADTESDLSAFLCEWFSAAGEYDAGVIYLTSLQPA
ncbi:Protein of unknown function DUF2158 [uncultured Caudovirales phage]|uniref:Uncharacterized protein n=1 Tax=uncultured Caudovirales phage TaxID=2100421 RepID=A0A6J7X7P4_9CAUD|nr:Protein of unknown function DUF2158 [uncultured Caudovirales phage]